MNAKRIPSSPHAELYVGDSHELGHGQLPEAAFDEQDATNADYSDQVQRETDTGPQAQLGVSHLVGGSLPILHPVPTAVTIRHASRPGRGVVTREASCNGLERAAPCLFSPGDRGGHDEHRPGRPAQ
jgi:hypothetical protein